jgi:hypothetical protein
MGARGRVRGSSRKVEGGIEIDHSTNINKNPFRGNNKIYICTECMNSGVEENGGTGG